MLFFFLDPLLVTWKTPVLPWYTGLLPCSKLDFDEVKTLKGMSGSRDSRDLLSGSNPEAISAEKPGSDVKNNHFQFSLTNLASNAAVLLVAQCNIKQCNVLSLSFNF